MYIYCESRHGPPGPNACKTLDCENDKKSTAKKKYKHTI